LKALALHPEIVDMRISYARSAANRIFSFVQHFYPAISNRQQSFIELYEQVVTPAFALAFEMQTSGSQYIFMPAMKSPKELYEFENVMADIVTSVTAINLDSSMPFVGNETMACDSEGTIGRPVLLIEPSLLIKKYSRHMGEMLVSLRRGTYLVKPFH
jgi:hypothetical protein